MSTGNNRHLTLFIQNFQALLTQLHAAHTSFLWCGTVMCSTSVEPQNHSNITWHAAKYE